MKVPDSLQKFGVYVFYSCSKLVPSNINVSDSNAVVAYLRSQQKEEKRRKKRKQKGTTRLEEMYRSRFEALYSKHAPHKFKKISSVMAKYKGNLGEALAAAEEKYAGEAGPPLPAALVKSHWSRG
ncbi:hypothetical protein TrVE_jg6358 [Triparma verrucosa]|nr:hypothetical protein TrVE_jg6358 [Triparma verrucosa]